MKVLKFLNPLRIVRSLRLDYESFKKWRARQKTPSYLSIHLAKNNSVKVKGWGVYDQHIN